MTNQTLKDLDKASMDILETMGVRLHHEGMLALAQMVRKGTPVIYGSATSGTDMRTDAFTIMHTAMNCRTAAFISDISLQGALREGTTAGQALTDKMTAKVHRMLARYGRPELPKDAIVRMDDCMTGLGIDLSALKDQMSSGS